MGYFNPCLGKIWTNPTVGFKIKIISKYKPTVGCHLFLTQTWT